MQDQGSVSIGSNKLFQNENSSSGPEGNDGVSVPVDAIGMYLQEKRISRNIELEEVSEATGISTGVLKILESDNREQFPAEVYIKGFYKKYAEFLGLNPDDILSAYQQHSDRQKKTGSRSSFNTVITLKGQDEKHIGGIVRRLLLPIIIVIGIALLYWIYVNYLTAFNPLDYFR